MEYCIVGCCKGLGGLSESGVDIFGDLKLFVVAT